MALVCELTIYDKYIYFVFKSKFIRIFIRANYIYIHTFFRN